MPLSADDFTRLAAVAADALASKGTPLAETIDQIAQDNSMNLEQIKRLCEASNNAAFKALFDKSPASDREVKFDVARAEDVVARRRGASQESSTKTASAPFDVMSELRPLAPARAGTVKEAAAPEPWVDPLEQRAMEKRASAEAQVRAGARMRLVEYLESVSATSRYKIASSIDEITAHFRRLGPDYAPAALEAFEKNAMAAHGERALPILREVRTYLPYGPLPTGTTPDAYHVTSAQPSMLSMKIASAVVEYDRNASACAVLCDPARLDAAVELHNPRSHRE